MRIHSLTLVFPGVRVTGRNFIFSVYSLLAYLLLASYVFTKLLRPLVKHWRSMGLRAIVYIDDGICASASESEAEKAKDIVVSDLDRAGFVLNTMKSQLSPVQVIDWLGFTLDLREGCFSVPQLKIDRLKSVIAHVYMLHAITARILASIVGQIISMSLAIGPIVRLRTRALYGIINQRIFWSDRLALSNEARDELNFWQHNIVQLNGRAIWFSPSVTRVAYSDTSGTGCGGYVVELGPEVSHGQWSVDQATCSSTWRELRAVDHVLRSFAPKLKGHTVKWLSDNQNVVQIIQYGSKKPHLQDGAMSIFETCFQHSIKLVMNWVPRSENEVADYISKLRDFDDWKVNPIMFQCLSKAWGPFTVDCFTSDYNCQLLRFHSKFYVPNAEAVDTFTVNWSGETCWLVPPLYLVGHALLHAEACKARGALVVPLWKSAAFWPLLCPDGRHLAPFFHVWQSFPVFDGIFLPGRSGSNIGDSLAVDSLVLACYFDFAVPVRSFNAGFCLYNATGYCNKCALFWPL